MCNIDNLITNNQTNVPLEVLKALLSGGTKNGSTKTRDESKRTVGLPRGSCTLADPGGGLSLRENQNKTKGHHLVV